MAHLKGLLRTAISSPEGAVGDGRRAGRHTGAARVGRQRGATVRAHPGPRVVPAGHTEQVSTATRYYTPGIMAPHILQASQQTRPAQTAVSDRPPSPSRPISNLTDQQGAVRYTSHTLLINIARPPPPVPPAATDPCRVAWCLSLLPSLVVRGRLGTEPERSRPGVVAPGIVFTDVCDELLAVGRRKDGQ